MLLARRINRILGGPFLSPWEVGELPEDFIETIEGLANLPSYAAARQMAEQRAEVWRQSLRGSQVH